MPYELKKVKKDKFKVCKKDDKNICFSKKGLPKKTAIKQKFAIEQSERRRFGMGNDSDNISTSDYNRYFNKYVKKMKKTSYTPFSLIDFISDFNAIFNNENLTVNDVIDKVVESTKKFRDDDERSQIDTDDESVDKVKAVDKSRSSSDVSELTIDEDKQIYDMYLDQLETFNDYNDVVISALEKELFKSTYENDYDDDLEPEEIIDQIIDEQAEEVLGKSTEEEREDLARKICLAVGVIGDGTQFPDFETEPLISADDIHDRKTKDRYVNYKNLKEMYEYILEKCKANDSKGGYCGWMVNGRDAFDMKTKNYRILSSLVYLTDQLNQSRYSIWCKDKCSEEQWNFSLFTSETFGIVFKHQGDQIMMSAGCKLSPQTNSIYIDLLCGIGGGKWIMEAFKRLYNQNSEDDLWTKVNKYKYLSLGSVSSYITVMFYYKQGLIEEERTIDLVMEKFEDEIKDRVNDGDYESFLEYCEEKLPYFESGDCSTDDQYLNDIFGACGCGGSKYLYPSINVKLGKTKADVGGETYVSYDYLKGFADFCKEVIAHPERYTYSKTDKVKEGVMEVFSELPRYARTLRTEKLRTKRMLRNPDLPRENLINQRFVNEQLRNTVSELEPSDADRIANKPRFAEQRMGLNQRQRQTAINRLEGNEPRTKYKRMKQLREFGMPSVRNVALDPFETEYNLVPETTITNNRRNRSGTTTVNLGRMVEPPQDAPFTTQGTIITSGDPRQGRGIKGSKFIDELEKYGINPVEYLKQLQKQAKKAGYNEKQITLDNDDKHKIRMLTEQGVKHVGAVGYKDYQIYKHLEKTGKVEKGTANKMRDRFVKSHSAITKKRNLGRNSANELAINILWGK